MAKYLIKKIHLYNKIMETSIKLIKIKEENQILCWEMITLLFKLKMELFSEIIIQHHQIMYINNQILQTLI